MATSSSATTADGIKWTLAISCGYSTDTSSHRHKASNWCVWKIRWTHDHSSHRHKASTWCVWKIRWTHGHQQSQTQSQHLVCVEDQVDTWTPAVTDTKPAIGVCGRSGELMDTGSHRHKASTWCVWKIRWTHGHPQSQTQSQHLVCVEDQVDTWTPAVTDTKPALGVCGRSGGHMDTSSHRHKASNWCVWKIRWTHGHQQSQTQSQQLVCVEDQVNSWTPAITDTKPALGVCGGSGELMDTSNHRHKTSTWCVWKIR